jgi:hypothetical protein
LCRQRWHRAVRKSLNYGRCRWYYQALLVVGKLSLKRMDGMAVGDGYDIETIGMRIVYENRWMRVREDEIRRRDGSSGIYGVVEKPDFVVIVPLEDDGRLHLVQQFRYPVRGRYWEFPQGSWEQAPGADPMEVARGELREETGLDAARMSYASGRQARSSWSRQPGSGWAETVPAWSTDVIAISMACFSCPGVSTER